MSITDQIQAQVTAHLGKRLFHLRPLLPGESVVRHLVVSEEIRECVTPPWAGNWMGLRHSTFRGTLDAFIQGEELSVAEHPFNKLGDAFLARVHPVEDEIWDIRSIDPNARIRCFGAFGGKNLFIALTFAYREDITTTEDWDYEIDRCKGMWNQFFGSMNRFKGGSLDEYVSNYHAV